MAHSVEVRKGFIADFARVLKQVDPQAYAIIASALEGWTYWELGDGHTQNDGYFRPDWLNPDTDDEDALTMARYFEAQEVLEAFGQWTHPESTF